ncbi:MAG: hypothetical protein FWC23_09090 [Chitinispirillia bacterium]|nr:hypothetical protein [Chitinispirillia bacterium]MCL2269323.1 hypothetical protein [Chitinispirillia bacterium]
MRKNNNEPPSQRPPVPPGTQTPHRNPDGKDACRLGARLKDLGGKRFAFYKMGMGGIELVGKIKGVT